MRRIGLLITTATLAVGLLAGTAPAASAAGGISSDTKHTLADLPCDGVQYPVLTSKNAYTTAAGTTVRLPKGVKSTLTTTDTTTTIDQVQDSYTQSVKLTIGLSPEFTKSLKGSAGADYTYTRSTTYTNGTTVAFSQSNQISLTAQVDGLTATPTFYKLQGWGAYWKCDVNTTAKVKMSADDAVRIDIVEASGWVLEKNGQPASKNDFTSN
ncbi:MAG: hypothetical protein IIZ13_12050 [Renibacterium sp.]|nr:hypothetical protein [Renibacterium sp.]